MNAAKEAAVETETAAQALEHALRFKRGEVEAAENEFKELEAAQKALDEAKLAARSAADRCRARHG